MSVAVGGRRGVLLDRDGVLNAVVTVDGVPHPPVCAGEVRLLPGVEEACVQLRRAGLLLICLTNQPDIARGTCDPEAVEEINRSLLGRLELAGVLVCPHDDCDGCTCRKPATGLLLEAARRWSLRLADCVMVGDRWRDIEAGRRAGCRTVHVDHGYGERRPAGADLVVGRLLDAVPWILAASAPASFTDPETRACPT